MLHKSYNESLESDNNPKNFNKSKNPTEKTQNIII
jgi:hypothetical protein